MQHFCLSSVNKYLTSMIQAVNFKALPVVNDGFLAMRVLCLFFSLSDEHLPFSVCISFLKQTSKSYHKLGRKDIQDYIFTVG